MKRLILSLLLILLFSGLMIGCGSRVVPIIPDRSVYCNTPLRPILFTLEENEFYTKENIQKLLTNLNELINYTFGLESTIQCFEESLKKEVK